MDIGEVGRHSDGGVLSYSAFGQALEENTLCIPAPAPLPGDKHSEFLCHIFTNIFSFGTMQPSLPYVIIGDEAFPLRNNLLRPYPGRNLPGMFGLCLKY